MSITTELHERVPGRVHEPGTPEFESGATVFLGAGTPDVVVRPTTVEEVAATLVTAAASHVPLAVRSGGHGSVPAASGIVLDLSAIADVELLDGDLVRVGSGAHWSDLAEALASTGRGVSSGDTRNVGIGGLALGGGIGWFVRTYGLTVDAIRELEVVTAAGEVLTASATEHPDLFWALRGGGGNFGVVTRFTLATSPIDGLVGGHVRFDDSDVGAVLRAWRDLTVDSPDSLNSTLAVMPAFGPEMPGGPSLSIALRGTEAELDDLLAPLLALPSVADVQLGPVDYADLLETAPPGRPPLRFVGGNGFVPDLSDAFLDAVEAALSGDIPKMALLRALGGAYRRVEGDATPLAFRDAEAFFVVNALLPADATDEQADAVAADLAAPLAHTVGRYANFTQESGDDVLGTIFPPATLARLRAIKAEWDPGDVFRPVHHVAPEG